MEEEAERDDIFYDVTLDYLLHRKYPHGRYQTRQRNHPKRAKHYRVIDGTLFRALTSKKKDTETLCCVIKDATARKQIFEGCHRGLAGDHTGRDKTLAKITQQYFWPDITNDVKEWVECCDVCQRTKQKCDHPTAELHAVHVTSQGWKQIGIDIVGPLPCTERGNKYIIVVTDYFTKWPEAKASPTKEAGNVADFLFDLFLRHGCPDIAISDQGRDFCNKNDFQHYENIDVLVELQESYRTKAAKSISCAQARQKRQYDFKHNTSSRILKVGDKVLKENSKNKSLKGGKLENPWTGPFYIQEVLGKGRYRLKTESGEIMKQTIHCARLKLYLDPIDVEAYGDDSKQNEHTGEKRISIKAIEDRRGTFTPFDPFSGRAVA
ncbi:hypothetical protein EMCRGX_G033999 [Ephydatia muelleri]